MGIFGDVIDGALQVTEGIGDYFQGGQRRKQADRLSENYFNNRRTRNQALLANDYTPAYVSDSIGPYQRSKSPLARAYLESMLTGDNQQAATAPWDNQSQAAADRFAARYGTVNDLLGSGEADRASTPWTTTKPKDVDKTALAVAVEADPRYENGYAKTNYSPTLARRGM